MDRGWFFFLLVGLVCGRGLAIDLPAEGISLMVREHIDGDLPYRQTVMGRAFGTHDSEVFRVEYEGMSSAAAGEQPLITPLPGLDQGLSYLVAPELAVEMQGKLRQALPVALVLDRTAVPFELKLAVHFLDGISPRQIVPFRKVKSVLNYPDGVVKEPAATSGITPDWIWATVFYRNEYGELADTPNGRILMKGCMGRGTELDNFVLVVYPRADGEGHTVMDWKRAPRREILENLAIRSLGQRVKVKLDAMSAGSWVKPKAVAVDYSDAKPWAGFLGEMGQGFGDLIMFAPEHVEASECQRRLRDMNDSDTADGDEGIDS